MARLFVPPERLLGTEVVLTGDAHRYLGRVLRLGPGDAIVLFDGQGNEVEALLGAVGSKSTTLVLGRRRRAAAVKGPRVTLVQALLRGERMDWLVQKATELGVARIWPVVTQRTVAPAAGETRQPRWATIATEASRQCGRADVPEVAAPRPLGVILNEPGAAAATRLLLWEGEEVLPLRQAFAGDEVDVTVLVGPEGGFGPEEVTLVRARGFRTVGLGRRILRSETAGIVAVALTQAALGGLD